MRKEKVKGPCPHGVTFAFVTPIQSTGIVGDLVRCFFLCRYREKCSYPELGIPSLISINRNVRLVVPRAVCFYSVFKIPEETVRSRDFFLMHQGDIVNTFFSTYSIETTGIPHFCRVCITPLCFYGKTYISTYFC